MMRQNRVLWEAEEDAMHDARVLLLTNDDGVDAPGLEALFQATASLGTRRVIAPVGACSGCGHAVTTTEPIPIHERPNGRIAVGGTPSDCVRLGLHHLAPGTVWVLSGINAGGNLGVDVFHSGTVAAAREGVIQGRQAAALSQYIGRGRAIDWEQTTAWAARVLRWLMEQGCAAGTFWNVNFPHPEPGAAEPEMVVCGVDPSPLQLAYVVEDGIARYTGRYQARARETGADVALCFEGAITVSQVPLLPDPHREIGSPPERP
jgi:5'-nucleotidase